MFLSYQSASTSSKEQGSVPTLDITQPTDKQSHHCDHLHQRYVMGTLQLEDGLEVLLNKPSPVCASSLCKVVHVICNAQQQMPVHNDEISAGQVSSMASVKPIIIQVGLSIDGGTSQDKMTGPGMQVGHGPYQAWKTTVAAIGSAY